MANSILTFNFEYQEAYTSKIEFDTQINEKHKGKEQRYPKWTYPKRIFTLKFDKNFKISFEYLCFIKESIFILL